MLANERYFLFGFNPGVAEASNPIERRRSIDQALVRA